MKALNLRCEIHLRGLLPACPGIRDTEALPVVAHAIVRRRQGIPYAVDVKWTDGTHCRYAPEHELDVLDSPPVTYIGTRRNHAA